MEHTLSVNATINGFPSLSLPNQPGGPKYAAIWDNHRLLTESAVSIKSPHGGGQNRHLGIVLTAKQYALISPVPFVRPTEPGQTPTIPAWIAPFDEKNTTRNTRNNIVNMMSAEICTPPSATNSSHHSKMPTSPPPKHVFTGYVEIQTLQIIGYLYGHCAHIFATEPTANNTKLQYPYNPDRILGSLYTRLNGCFKYSTSAGEPVTEGQLF